MKKYTKLFLVAIMTIFISIIPTYAKEVSLKQQEGKSERDTFDFIINRENPDAAYVYLIGKYAFTSAHEMGLQDMMLAARSIQAAEGELKDKEIPEKLDNMTIYLFKHPSGSTEWQPQIVVGKIELPEKFNVKYIDYHYVKKDKKVNTDKMVNIAMKKLTSDMFTPTNTSNNLVTVDIKTAKLKENIVQGMSSGVFSVLTNLVQNAKVNSITFKYDGVDPLTIDNSNLDIEDMATWFDKNKEKIFGKSKDIILADLLDKEFTATINLGETEKEAYVSKSHNTPTETYTVKFTGTREKVDTDTIAKEALNALKSDIFEVKDKDNLTNGKIVINIKENKLEEKIIKGMSSGVYPLLQQLVNNKDVESVDFVYSGDSNVKYTITKDLNLEDMATWFEENCKKILDYDVNDALTVDLINKKFTAHINLKNYAQKQDKNPDNYTISFDGQLPEVDPEELLKNVMKKVNKNYFEKDEDRSENQKIVIKVKSIDKDIIKGMGSGLYQALSEIANTNGVASVEFSYNGSVTYNLTKEENLEKMATWFEENKEKIFGKADEIKLADLHKKEFTVKVDTGRVGKLKSDSKDTYTIEMLKTHNVTFHDDKEKDENKQKEVVTVYDGETIPEEEVQSRKKRDTQTEKFLGWYEEITEGVDEEEEFNFEETPITDDIELDAHWGNRLTENEQKKLQEAAENALNTINLHKEKYLEISIKDSTISIISHKGAENKVGYSLAGAGVKTALSNFLDSSKNPAVESITLNFHSSLDNKEYSQNISKTDVDGYVEFAEKFDELFQEATGKAITAYTWKDLEDNINNIKVKVNLKNDKVFEEGNGEYTFKLEIQPTEGE